MRSPREIPHAQGATQGERMALPQTVAVARLEVMTQRTIQKERVDTPPRLW